MRIAFITAEGCRDQSGNYIPGGTTWHRATLPANGLRRGGHNVTITDRFLATDTGLIRPIVGNWNAEIDPERDPTDQSRYYGDVLDPPDVIVFIRFMFADIAKVTERAVAGGQLVVQDIDDWIWGIPTTNQGYWATHPKVNPDHNRDHYRKAVARASLVTCSTEYLAGRVADRINPNVAVLPNMVDLAAFSRVRERNELREAGWHPAIGWVGSTAFRGGDLETLKGVIGPFMQARGLRFIHGGATVGGQAVTGMLGLPEDVPVELRAETPPDVYPSLLRGMDVGIAPLAPKPFNEAKSACKVMEYAAAGVCYVASDFGPYHDWEGAGAVCRRPRDWWRQLERLCDPDERAVQRKRQFEAVAPQDVKIRWPDWADTYKRALQ